jgi:hypothetical protein
MLKQSLDSRKKEHYSWLRIIVSVTQLQEDSQLYIMRARWSFGWLPLMAVVGPKASLCAAQSRLKSSQQPTSTCLHSVECCFDILPKLTPFYMNLVLCPHKSMLLDCPSNKLSLLAETASVSLV